MNDNEFRQLISTYGASPDHWPAAKRAQALTLLDESAQAREWLSAERDLDSLLDIPVNLAVNQHQLRESILLSIRPSTAQLIGRWLTANLWRQAAAACLPLAVGILIGGSTVSDTTVLQKDEEIFIMATSESLLSYSLWSEHQWSEYE